MYYIRALVTDGDALDTVFGTTAAHVLNELLVDPDGAALSDASGPMPEVAVLTESTVGPARFRAGEGTAGMAVDRDTEWTIDGNGHVMVWHGRQGW